MMIMEKIFVTEVGLKFGHIYKINIREWNVFALDLAKNWIFLEIYILLNMTQIGKD